MGYGFQVSNILETGTEGRRILNYKLSHGFPAGMKQRTGKTPAEAVVTSVFQKREKCY